MRYTETIEICDMCGKRFYGAPINKHGSYDYIVHTNFSNNIVVLFARTKDVPQDKRADAIVKEFFENGIEKLNKQKAIEFLECFKHYKYPDEKLLNDVFEKIQKKIDRMK